MFIGNINNLMEADKNAKKKRVEKGMKKLQEQMCPFSFVKEDEEIQRRKMEKQKIYESTKEKIKPFKANSIKPSSRGGLTAEQRLEKEKEERIERIQKNVDKIMKESKMPPRLEMHEKMKILEKKKLKEAEKKRKKEEKKMKKKKNLDPPKWDKTHKIELNKLKSKMDYH